MTASGAGAAAIFSGDEAARYAAKIRRRVPGYEAMHEVCAALLLAKLGDRAEILVVGAGDGQDLLTLARAAPEWRFTAVEPEPAMFALLAERVADAGLDARVVTCRGYVDDLPRVPSFDAATAILVSHFLPDDGRRQGFFESVAARLRPGGPLVVADLAVSSPAVQGAYRRWLGLNGLDEPAVAAVLDRIAREFHPLRKARQQHILAQSGFARPELVFQGLRYAAWCAARLKG